MSLDIFDVAGQKVLLTGAGRGIGKGIALAFAQAGADVAVTGLTPTGVNQVAEDVRALGRVCLPLTGDATTAADTDFTAKLVDVEPCGAARSLTDGIIRARYRQGTDEARPITPGAVEEYVIDLVATSNVFKAGHRIRLEISSSNFPRFDRNFNTAGDPWLATESLPAMQTIYHDGQRPSRIHLPIIPTSAA